MLQLGLDRDRRFADPAKSAPAPRLDDESDDGEPLSGAVAGASDVGVDGGPFDPQRSFLLASFRSFFADVVRLRQAAVRDPGQLLPSEVGAYSPESGASQVARAISARLQHQLEQLALDAGAHGGEYGASLFSEAQYVMAALADEVFLTTEWSGREAWLNCLLERALFRTQVAGEEVFRRIDRLMLTRTGVAAELGAVYFIALGAGFEGQFRGTNSPVLREYRQRLYRFVFRRDASRAPGVLLAQPYEHTSAPTRPTRLPLVHRWALVLGLTIMAYVIVSHVIWRRVTSDIRAIHADIRSVLVESQKVQ